MVIFLLYSLKASEFPSVFNRNFLELIVKQGQSMIKLKVQLFQSVINYTFWFLFLVLNIDFDFLLKIVFTVYECGVYQLMIDYPWRREWFWWRVMLINDERVVLLCNYGIFYSLLLWVLGGIVLYILKVVLKVPH